MQRSQIISSLVFNNLVLLIFPILVLLKKAKQTNSEKQQQKKKKERKSYEDYYDNKNDKKIQNDISYRKGSLITFNEATQILTASLMIAL